MKYIYKVFLYKNGQKSTDLSNYLTVPIYIEDRLNEELDTGEIILDCMPISTKFDFPPKTKIRIERYIDNILQKKWDMIVEHDDIEEYVGTSNLCCHRINLIEPSAVAQGIHVDNIALTYELQDVNLYYRTTLNDNTITQSNIRNYDNNSILHETSYEDTNEGVTSTRVGHFKNHYRYIWKQLEDIQLINKNLDASQSHEVSFKAPQLFCQGSYDGEAWVDLFQVNSTVKITRYATINGETQSESEEIILYKEIYPSKLPIKNDDLFYSDGNTAALRTIDTTIETSGKYVTTPNTHTTFDKIYSTGDVIAEVVENKDDLIKFNTESLPDELIEEGCGFYYKIDCMPNPNVLGGLITEIKCSFYAIFSDAISIPGGGVIPPTIVGFFNCEGDDSLVILGEESLFIQSYFYCKNMYSKETFSPFLIKGEKYSCYNLLKKALLTIDSQIIDNDVIGIDDIEYFIKIDDYWLNKLKNTTVYESIFEQKNLWEVLLQIGNYIHAIPYLEFAEGEDRFILKFRQLGGKSGKDKKSETKITIFNSQNLNEYFTQFDSYITNLFSPQNDIEEWLTVKTDDSSYLISNDTAILKTTYNISEIVEFDIQYKTESKSALNCIFEKSVYDILTSEYRVTPGKGNSIYFILGNNQIKGLNYVPPNRDNNSFMALKTIVASLFPNVNRNKLKFNDLIFHIKYKTQDSMRLSQIRPDIENFIRNSSFEKYPHHEQFYGQQDKIVDSEKMSLNLMGRLIRVGNNICQSQEQVNKIEDEKESGDLIQIHREPYYVTVVENELYPDATFQKVTYSKNYNQLSQIVTIPSEPRFYEVSERSKIRREVRFMEFFKIANINDVINAGNPRFLNKIKWKETIKSLLFKKDNFLIPNFAFTRFSCDKKKVHKGSNGQYIPPEEMFPSTELERNGDNVVLPKSSSIKTDVIVPLLHYPINSGIVFEWDMEDNFKAGDCVDTDIKETGLVDLGDNAYFAMQSVRYCDIMGRAELCSFNLFKKGDFSKSEIQSLPKAIYQPSEEESFACVPTTKLVALDKDCREALSFNYQINLLHIPDENNDDFVVFANLFGKKESDLYCCLLNQEISLFDTSVNFSYDALIMDRLNFQIIENIEKNVLEIRFVLSETIDLTNVKSIVFYQIDDTGKRATYLAKNVGNAPNDKKLQSLAIYPVFND